MKRVFLIMAHFTYIIYSETFDLYYKGETADIENRLADHNADLSRYTAGKGLWKLVWTKAFASRREALIEEKRLKKLNRRSLEKLIKEYVPVVSLVKALTRPSGPLNFIKERLKLNLFHPQMKQVFLFWSIFRK